MTPCDVPADPDAKRHAAVVRGVHPLSDEHDVIAVARRAADADVGERAVDVERAGEVVGARRDDDRPVRGDRGDGVLQLRHCRDVDDGARRRRQRHRRERGACGRGGRDRQQQEREAPRAVLTASIASPARRLPAIAAFWPGRRSHRISDESVAWPHRFQPTRHRREACPLAGGRIRGAPLRAAGPILVTRALAARARVRGCSRPGPA